MEYQRDVCKLSQVPLQRITTILIAASDYLSATVARDTTINFMAIANDEKFAYYLAPLENNAIRRFNL